MEVDEMRTVLPLLLLLACTITVTDDKGTPPTGDTGTPTTGDRDDDGDGFTTADDCDDAEPRVFPGAAAACPFEDADCDGVPDERLSVPTDEPDLSVALATGGLVCLEPGEYPGAVLTGGSATLGATEPGAASVVGTGGPALTVEGSAVLVVTDLVLRGDSGLLVVDDASLTLEGVTVDGPSCDCEGAVLVADDATIVVRDTVVRDVRQTFDGEGPIRLDGSTATFERARIEGTEVSGALGGVFAFRRSTVTMTDTTISDTHLSAAGGSMQGGVFFAVDSTITATRLAVLDTLLDGGGVSGGVFYGFGATFDLEDVAVAGTTADVAGEVVRGLVAEVALDGAFDVVDGTFLAGSATADSCVGLAFESVGPALSLTNVVVQDYRCPSPQSLVDVAGSVVATITYSSFADVDGGFDGVTDPVGTLGNVALAGAFVSGTAPWDLAPAAGSPLIDLGDPARLDADGSPSDIGAVGSTF